MSACSIPRETSSSSAARPSPTIAFDSSSTRRCFTRTSSTRGSGASRREASRSSPPSRAGSHYRHRQNRAARRRFFFYARPNHYRNLFVRGLEAINTALLRSTLRPNEWDFYFVGQSIPKLTLSHAVEPRCAEDLAWPDYAALIRSVDIGVSLMNSPHPSYPPLDLAACGAVAVTNRYGPKRSLERYSSNIICADPSTEALAEAISDAVRLADDEERRQQNYESSPIRRDWSASVAPVLDALARTL